MSKLRLATAMVSAAALMCAVPGWAQDEASDGGGDSTETQSLLAYLGLTAASGSSTTGDGFASIEGHILATILANEVAEEIRKEINGAVKSSGKPYVFLLTGDQTFDLTAYYEAGRQVRFFEEEVRQLTVSARKAGCHPEPDGKSTDPLAGSFTVFGELSQEVETSTSASGKESFKFTATDFLGFIKTDTTFTNVPVTLGEQLIKDALVATALTSGDWVIPHEIAMARGGTTIVDKVSALRALSGLYAGNYCANFDVSEDDQKKIVKEAQTVASRGSAIVASKDGAPSMLDRAIRVATLVEDPDQEVFFARVNVDKSGGTVVNSSNIWTSLGVPGITIRGGLIASYRLVNPENGTLHTAGTFICRLPKKLLMNVSEGDLPESGNNCERIPKI